MFCSNCGNEIVGQQMFCPFCGNNLSYVSNLYDVTQSTVNSVLFTQNTAVVRQSELMQMDKLLSYFSVKQKQYDEYDYVSKNIDDWSNLSAKAALVWGIILFVISFVISYCAVCITDFFSLLALALPFFGTGVVLFVLFFCLNGRRRRKLNNAINRYYELATELSDYYYSYENCPIGPEYTNPSNLVVVKRTIISGRADTIKEALNILLEDAHRERMENLSVQAARYAEQAAHNSSVAAVFSIGNYFK